MQQYDPIEYPKRRERCNEQLNAATEQIGGFGFGGLGVEGVRLRV